MNFIVILLIVTMNANGTLKTAKFFPLSGTANCTGIADAINENERGWVTASCIEVPRQ